MHPNGNCDDLDSRNDCGTIRASTFFSLDDFPTPVASYCVGIPILHEKIESDTNHRGNERACLKFKKLSMFSHSQIASYSFQHLTLHRRFLIKIVVS
jgi:hypothetical protein